MKKRIWGKRLASFGGVCLAGALLLAGALAAEQPESGARDGELTGRTAAEVVEQMGLGWNLGNTFDATGGNAADVFSQEQSWGNPKVTEELIAAVQDGGFTTIRIPVTWYKHLSSDGNFTIDEAFLERVKTVVDYAYERGMYIILNVHHEEWINTSKLSENEEAIAWQLSCIWAQVAEAFADYDQHLIFEGMNEPRLAGTNIEWSGNQEAYQTINYLNQVFTNTVRNNGKGHNPERCLMIPGYAASNSSSILESISLPTWNGEVVNNLVISVHGYAPYDFCLSDTMKDFDPAKSECTSAINQMFADVKSQFLDQGIPVVLGETSATNKDNTEARERWALYMGRISAEYGIPCVIWDNGYNGNSGGECHAYINRKTLEWNFPTVVNAFLEGIESVEWGSALTGGNSQPTDSLLEGTVLWSKSEGQTSTKEWDASFISMAAKSSYVTEGREIAVVYTGEGEVKMVLDSAEKSVWWIPVNASRVEEVSGKKVAYFTYEDMLREMNANGVDNGSQLRNMNFLAANGSITAYEVTASGDLTSVTYRVNGQQYATGTELPEEPKVAHMTFAGWYTTKDYQPGTEYDGTTEPDGEVTVYAKLTLTEMPTVEALGALATPTPTAAPTKAPTKAPTPTATVAAEKDDSEKDDKPSEFSPLWIIGLLAAVAVVAIIAVVVLILQKKKTKNDGASKDEKEPNEEK